MEEDTPHLPHNDLTDKFKSFRLDRKLTKGSMRKLPRSIKRDKSKFTNTKLDEAGMLILSYKAKLEAAIIQLTMLKRENVYEELRAQGMTVSHDKLQDLHIHEEYQPQPSTSDNMILLGNTIKVLDSAIADILTKLKALCITLSKMKVRTKLSIILKSNMLEMCKLCIAHYTQASKTLLPRKERVSEAEFDKDNIAQILQCLYYHLHFSYQQISSNVAFLETYEALPGQMKTAKDYVVKCLLIARKCKGINEDDCDPNLLSFLEHRFKSYGDEKLTSLLCENKHSDYIQYLRTRLKDDLNYCRHYKDICQHNTTYNKDEIEMITNSVELLLKPVLDYLKANDSAYVKSPIAFKLKR